MLRDLEANSLDLAVVTLPVSGRSTEIELFYDDEFLAVASKGSVMPKSDPDAPFLMGRIMMLYDGGNTRRATDEWFAAAGNESQPAIEFGSVEAIKELGAAGLGWSLLAGLALKRDRVRLVTSPRGG